VPSPIAPNTLEVGLNLQGEVVINHPDLKPDADGVGHIVFSPKQANDLATLLWQNARRAGWEKKAPNAREEATKPQVRWARLIISEGSEAQIAWHKHQSVFTSTRKMGNVTCIVLDDADLDAIIEEFPELKEQV
jgi:hypothetical protein